MASIKTDVYVCIVESVFGTHPYCLSVATQKQGVLVVCNMFRIAAATI
jgi:hypothetical protein